jgi:hypothetical protein
MNFKKNQIEVLFIYFLIFLNGSSWAVKVLTLLNVFNVKNFFILLLKNRT